MFFPVDSFFSAIFYSSRFKSRWFVVVRFTWLVVWFLSCFSSQRSLFILNNHHPSYLWARTAWWWNTRKKCFSLSLLHPYRSHPIQQLHSCVHCEHKVERRRKFVYFVNLSVSLWFYLGELFRSSVYIFFFDLYKKKLLAFGKASEKNNLDLYSELRRW